MARFKIYSADGKQVRYEGCPTYNGTYLKVSYLEFREIASPTPIEWEIGDYVEYSRTGYRYKLYSLPQPRKQARRNTCGGAFIYSNVQFLAPTQALDIALFRDLVLGDNLIHFSTQPAIATFENVYGIKDRIQACLDDFYPGEWDIRVFDNLDDETRELISTPREFSVSGVTILGALEKIYEVWKNIGWVYSYDEGSSKHIITIGRPNSRTEDNTTSPFLYGLGKGLTAIRKSMANKDGIATRLYVYGSYRNMVSRYYNSLDIANAENVDIENLMIPLEHWGKTDGKPDARLAYIQASDDVVARMGLIPKVVYFNGGDNEDIYPSINGMTFGDLRAAKIAEGDTTYFPSSRYDATERVDEIKDCESLLDDGMSSAVGNAKTERASFTTDDVVYSDFINSEGMTDAINLDLFAGSCYMDKDNRLSISMPSEDCYFLAEFEPASFKAYLELNIDGAITKRQMIATEVDDVTAASLGLGERLVHVYRLSIPSFTNIEASGTLTDVIMKARIEVSYNISAMPAILTGCYFKGREVKFLSSVVLQNTFKVYLKQIGFNIMDRAALGGEGIATLNVNTGKCAGMSFTIKSCTYRKDEDDWELVAYRGKDTSVGMMYPNSIFGIQEGDRFVLTDIAMPNLYIDAASERLYREALAMLEQTTKVLPYYEPEIDAKRLAQTNERLIEGMYMCITDEDIVDGEHTDYVLIDTLTINEGETNIPTYKVTLREQKKLSFQQSTTKTLATLSQAITEGVPNRGNGGVSSYEDILDKPSIDGHELTGEMKSYEDLGLISNEFFELDTTSVPGKTFIKAKYDGLYTLGDLVAGGVGTSSGIGGGNGFEWEQLYKDADNSTQIANLTLGNGETIPILVPNTLKGGLTGLLTLNGNLNEGDVPYWDGFKWTNRQMSSGSGGSGGGASTSNPYYDDAVIATYSDGSTIRTEFTNGSIPAWWAYNISGGANDKNGAKRHTLVRVDIGKNCTGIGKNAFYDCTALKTIYSYSPSQVDPMEGFNQMNSYNGVLHYPSGADYSWWTIPYSMPNYQTLGDYSWNSVADAVTPTSGGESGGTGGGESVIVINSLLSSSATAALSANQGRVLNEKINALTLLDLVGVRISEPTNGQVLTYKSGVWRNADPTGAPSEGGVTNLSGLLDVTLTNITNGDLLIYANGGWVNIPSSNFIDGGKTITSLSEIPDVKIPSPSNGDVLYFNGESWVNYPSSNFGTTSPSQPSMLPLAANGTRGGIQLGYATDGLNVALKVADEKAYVTVPRMYIGTTEVQLSSLAQRLEGITDLVASGKVSADSCTLTSNLTASIVTAKSTIKIGDAKLTYANGVVTLQKADGGICSFVASGEITAGM